MKEILQTKVICLSITVKPWIMLFNILVLPSVSQSLILCIAFYLGVIDEFEQEEPGQEPLGGQPSRSSEESKRWTHIHWSPYCCTMAWWFSGLDCGAGESDSFYASLKWRGGVEEVVLVLGGGEGWARRDRWRGGRAHGVCLKATSGSPRRIAATTVLRTPSRFFCSQVTCYF
jgi:hypothetical protein